MAAATLYDAYGRPIELGVMTKDLATPKADIDLIRERLKLAERHYQEGYRGVTP